MNKKLKKMNKKINNNKNKEKNGKKITNSAVWISPSFSTHKPMQLFITELKKVVKKDKMMISFWLWRNILTNFWKMIKKTTKMSLLLQKMLQNLINLVTHVMFYPQNSIISQWRSHITLCLHKIDININNTTTTNNNNNNNTLVKKQHNKTLCWTSRILIWWC